MVPVKVPPVEVSFSWDSEIHGKSRFTDAVSVPVNHVLRWWTVEGNKNLSWKIFDHFSLYIWTRTSKKEKQIENGLKYRFQITNKNNSTQGTEQSARMFEHKQINRRLGGRRQETHKLMKLFFSSHSQKSDPETTFVFFLMCEYNLMGESFFPPNLRLL